MKRIFLPFATIIAVLLFSCNSETAKTTESPATTAAFNLDSAKVVIAASNASYGNCFATGDSAKMVSLYTSDACIYPSNMSKKEKRVLRRKAEAFAMTPHDRKHRA